jgi:hypothetical protein
MKRRDFLANSALAMLGLSFSKSVFSNTFNRTESLTTFQPVNPDSMRELRAIFTNLDHAKAIGRAYLETQHAVRYADELAKRSGLDLRSPNTPMKEHIRARSRSDFSQGNTVIVIGWVLSVSEASVCALLTLA